MDVFEAPTWREASPGIAFALRYGSPADVEEVTKALMQMARLADAMAIVITHDNRRDDAPWPFRLGEIYSACRVFVKSVHERSGVIPLHPEES